MQSKQRNMESELITQEHPLGCAVACVASRCGISYQDALDLFETKDSAWTRGFYCSEVIAALAKKGLNYEFEPFDPLRHQRALEKQGALIFIKRSDVYPAGHYLLRTSQNWMNPWSNFPKMTPATSAFQRNIPGQIEYILYESNYSTTE